LSRLLTLLTTFFRFAEFAREPQDGMVVGGANYPRKR